jgi:hypothetical protein
MARAFGIPIIERDMTKRKTPMADNNGFSSALAATESALAEALIEYIAERSDPGAPTHDMADTALEAINDALRHQHGFTVELNQ